MPDPSQGTPKGPEPQLSIPKDVTDTPSTSSTAFEPVDPKTWPLYRKYLNLFLVSFMSLMGYFSSAVYMPATTEIREYFNTSITVVNTTIAFFVLLLGISPLFFAPLSEQIGRRWIYVGGIFLFTVFTILCGISTNLGAFIFFRLCQGIFASIGQGLGGGSIADMFEGRQRSRAVSFYMFGTIFGPAIAPTVGGFITRYLGFRWLFYIKAIIGGLLTLASFFFLDETLHQPHTKTPFLQRLKSVRVNPISTFGLLLKPPIGLVCLAVSTAFGWFYLMVTNLPLTFSDRYGFSVDKIGLLYLPGGIGNCSGAIVAGLIAHRCYLWLTRRNLGKPLAEFYLAPIVIALPLLLAGLLIYGWAIDYQANLFVALLGYLFFTHATMLSITLSNTYLVEAYLERSASVVSVNNCLRNIFATVFSVLAAIVRNGLGDGWTYTTAAITVFVFYLPLLLVWFYGPAWRAKG
ncbi:MFS general substrate transporter [Hesseltinella vesiculosa]|uniref:MFS general substrate transporter n=1 Tax=Hesseltinella vesiculosa TaxID=101127 RepID=A0A1X2GRM7_9FUNG|nr:MFS general substrate transporter [Hesseltinella vesiculosa]